MPTLRSSTETVKRAESGSMSSLIMYTARLPRDRVLHRRETDSGTFNAVHSLSLHKERERLAECIVVPPSKRQSGF